MKDQTSPFASLGDVLLQVIREAVREEIKECMLGGRTRGYGLDAKLYLTVKEAATRSGLGVSTIRLLIRKRQLRAQRVGRRVLIKRSDLERFLEANPIEALTD